MRGPNPSPWSGGRVARSACAVAVLVVLVVASGCQTYEPRPLDGEAHRAAWHGRTLENASLAPFLERLGEAGVDEPVAFDPGDGLGLAEGQLFALVFNPGLRLERLRLDRARAASETAGLWDDPSLDVELLRIGRDVPNQWIVSPELSFSIPLSGRLDAERAQADAEQRAAVRRALETEWSVRHELRHAWAEWSAALFRLEETARFADTLAELSARASQLAGMGELDRAEAALFELGRARRSNEVRRLRGDVEAKEQELRSHLGLAPEAPLTLIPSLANGTGSDEGPEAIAARNPTLARLREEYAVAEERLRREVLKQYPDLTFGPKYENEDGQSSFGLIAGIPLPLLNRNEQGIAEAHADREIARAAFETEYELLVGRWAAAGASARGVADQRADLERTVVPLVERQLADAVRVLGLGESGILVLLESLSAAHETKLDLIDARLAETLAHAEIDYVVGPAPATEETP